MTTIETAGPQERPPPALPPEAQRALAEAEALRMALSATKTACPEEFGGRKGPDPVRFGDWEVGGIASDF
jgi:hypothetical protein